MIHPIPSHPLPPIQATVQDVAGSLAHIALKLWKMPAKEGVSHFHCLIRTIEDARSISQIVNAIFLAESRLQLVRSRL